MQFRVDTEIFKRFPGINLPVVVAYGIDNQHTPEAVAEHWRSAWAEAAAQAASYGNAQSHPRIRPWRERFKAMGVSGKEFPSSAEALLRRALKGGEPFYINALVDFYNTISLRYFVPAGGFDLDQVHEPLELRLTRADETFTALDEQTPQEVRPGEIAYTSGSTILTRHFVWRQARTGLITPTTRSVFLVSEILGEVGPDVAEMVQAELRAGLQNYFDVPTLAFLVNERHPAIEW